MAFDAGMLACTVAEIRALSLGARVEKVFQPEKDEIVHQRGEQYPTYWIYRRAKGKPLDTPYALHAVAQASARGKAD